jgi:hypothetical protein
VSPCNKKTIKPKKEFVYNSVIQTLHRFFTRPSFAESIEAWRKRTPVEGMIFDVYDGDYWNQFKKEDEDASFVSKPKSLMFSLNVDWFNPTKTMQYSIGAIYLVVNNLPRDQRFKRQNMILVGLMPGPKEPKTSEINHFLRPLVDELLDLYNCNTTLGDDIRGALMLVNCDIPAAKKVSGFTAINSMVPCHKCSNVFPAQRMHMNLRCFGNFDEKTLKKRDNISNREQANLWINAGTMAEREKIEHEFGTRWSELHRLEYFDAVRCTVIDGLHNLYLGTAKKMIQMWKTIENPNQQWSILP